MLSFLTHLSAAGSNLQYPQCPPFKTETAECMAAFLALHLTSGSTAYLEVSYITSVHLRQTQIIAHRAHGFGWQTMIWMVATKTKSASMPEEAFFQNPRDQYGWLELVSRSFAWSVIYPDISFFQLVSPTWPNMNCDTLLIFEQPSISFCTSIASSMPQTIGWEQFRLNRCAAICTHAHLLVAKLWSSRTSNRSLSRQLRSRSTTTSRTHHSPRTSDLHGVSR